MDAEVIGRQPAATAVNLERPTAAMAATLSCTTAGIQGGTAKEREARARARVKVKDREGGFQEAVTR